MKTLLTVAALATTAAFCLPAHAGHFEPGGATHTSTLDNSLGVPYLPLSSTGQDYAVSAVGIGGLQNGSSVPGGSIYATYNSVIDWTWTPNPNNPNGDLATDWSVSVGTNWYGGTYEDITGDGGYSSMDAIFDAQVSANGATDIGPTVEVPRDGNTTYNGSIPLHINTQPAANTVTTTIVIKSKSVLGPTKSGNPGTGNATAGNNTITIVSCLVG